MNICHKHKNWKDKRISKVQQKQEYEECKIKCKYLNTLPSLALIIFFLEMLKISKMISSKSKNIVKENSEYLRIFHLLK
jgi:hypothetical protein